MPRSATGRVLVTGGFGLVGTATVARLREVGHDVVVAELRTPANLAAAERLGSSGVAVEWVDLTDGGVVRDLLGHVRPTAVVHLAALIPPLCYALPTVARAVAVDATGHLVDACRRLPEPPRLVHASSVAVCGSRNPHTTDELLTGDTPAAPSDLYGALKAESEVVVREAGLDTVVLRLGGVMTAAREAGLDRGLVYLGSALPADGRIQTIDVRDAARAFTAAVDADVVGEVLMVGGDDSHRLRQGDVATSLAAARGVGGILPAGRPGDPADDAAWFATDWMDTTRAQQTLDFQRVSWPALLEEVRAGVGRSRHLLRVGSPILRRLLARDDARHALPGPYADPWAAVRARWGEEAARRAV